MTRLGGDDGSITVEVVIIAPVAIALLCLVALVGRTSTAHQHLDEAARDAARSASLERDPVAARNAAHASAAATFTAAGFTCNDASVVVDTSRFGPGGQVTVTVACGIALSDLGLIGVSGTRTMTSTAVSVLDLYRATR